MASSNGDPQRKSDENYARRIDALRLRARHSRRWAGMPHDRKHKRATCLLRCGDSSENSKADSGRERRVAAGLQRPLHRGRRPNHRQAKGYLPRLLKIDAFRPWALHRPAIKGPTGSGVLGALAGASPVALQNPIWSGARLTIRNGSRFPPLTTRMYGTRNEDHEVHPIGGPDADKGLPKAHQELEHKLRETDE